MKKCIFMLFMLLGPGVAPAAPITLDFEELPSGSLVSGQYLDVGVLIGSSLGDVTVFSGCCASSGVNSLDGSFFREVTVTFVDPADPLRPAVTDFFSVTLGDIDLPGNGITAYDLSGAVIGQVLAHCEVEFACPDSNLLETLTLSLPGIHRVVIAAGGQLSGNLPVSEATVDDITFNPVVAQVPEASSPQLFAAGLVLLGCVLLRRRRAVSRGRIASR